eukprot:CAMPEP_0167751562 /NCGR_PEP_ID=MMETSP0110_2-20121227/6654_1 /TAXON_ID=629695 /ORGANISM="Gymnochlora sp., Strain CCMP2014" /LENGTH=332 /DNA_ID=CAMNT_0007637085 /DNA_START=310 /DNA_END=1308 /DNA_ORIENTATION=-
MHSLPLHKNLLQILATTTWDKKLCLVTPFCAKGSLDKLHSKVDMKSEKGFFEVASQIAKGLSALHEAKMIHRDLACRNCLMKANGTVLIADYGLSKTTESYFVGNSKFAWAWAGPEVFSGGSFSAKSDVYSLGVTFWEMLTGGKDPYHHEKKTQQFTFVRHKVIQGDLKLIVPSNAPRKCSEITKACLAFDPAERPTSEKLAKMSPNSPINLSDILSASYDGVEEIPISTERPGVTVVNYKDFKQTLEGEGVSKKIAVRDWDVEQVYSFIKNLDKEEIWSEYAEMFKKTKINGRMLVGYQNKDDLLEDFKSIPKAHARFISGEILQALNSTK